MSAGTSLATSSMASRQMQGPMQAPPIMSPSNTVAASTPEPPLLFNGLRVRMGISGGVLPAGAKTQGSDILNRAKEVSDAGAGGQVGTGGLGGWGQIVVVLWEGQG